MPALKDPQKEKACREFVINNLTRAAAYRESYPKSKTWKEKTVWNKSCMLFKEREVQVRVDELKDEFAELAKEEFKVDATYVLRRLTEIDNMDFADIFEEDGETLKPIREWPKVWRTYISSLDVHQLFAGRGDDREMIGMLKKIKWPDKVKNLELLGKHVTVQAFRDQVGHSGPGGGPIEHSDVTWREKLRQETDKTAED